MVTYTSHTLYSRRKSPQYLFVESKGRSSCFSRYLLPLPGIKPHPYYYYYYYYYLVGWDLTPIRSLCRSPRFVQVPVLRPHIGLLYIFPRMIYEGDCGVIGGANDDCRGNRSTRRKPAQRHFVPPQNPHA
jgi:hypothetical protein